MADIFISYAHEDASSVERLAAVLEAHGWSVFWDRKLRTGSVGWNSIQAELDQAKCVIVVWTSSSVQKMAVRSEAERRFEDDVLLPVRLVPIESIPLPFGTLQTADLSDWNSNYDQASLAAFLADVTKVVGRLPIELPWWKRVVLWLRAKRPRPVMVVRALWFLVIVSGGGVLFIMVTTYVADYKLKTNLRTVDSLLNVISAPGQSPDRNAAFERLATPSISGLLEAYTIEGIVSFVRTQHRRSGGCVPLGLNPTPSVLQPAFDLIRILQAQRGRERGLVGRGFDWVTRTFAPNPPAGAPSIVLDSTDLHGAQLHDLDLDSASFQFACLSRSHFDRAQLRRADFSGAILLDTQFPGAQLQCAIFVNDTIIGANFDFANLSWSTFSGAHLRNISNWNTVKSFASTRLGGEVEGNPARNAYAVAAIARGASRPDVDIVDWVRARDRERQRGGACAVNRFGGTP
jgi:hypothetical protein